jgi:hypothetical protein
MSIKDRILGKDKDEAELLVEKSLADFEAAREDAITLEARQTSLRHDLEQLEVQLDEAALKKELRGDTKAYDDLQEKIGKIKDALETNLRAIRAAGVKRDAAADALHRAKHSDILKQAHRFNAMRLTAAKKIAESIAMMNEGWQALHLTNAKLAAFAGPALYSNGGTGGTFTSRQDVIDAVTQELSRVSSPPPLTTKGAPALPGARNVVVGNPSKLPPLVEQVEAANAYVMRKLEARPSEIAQASPPKPKPKVEQPAAPVEVAQPAGPSFSADMVQAGIKRVHMS